MRKLRRVRDHPVMLLGGGEMNGGKAEREEKVPRPLHRGDVLALLGAEDHRRAFEHRGAGV